MTRLVLLLALVCSVVSAAEKRPNILFIYADDQPYTWRSASEELRNLARVAEHKDQVGALRAKAIGELKRTNAPFAEALPRVMPRP